MPEPKNTLNLWLSGISLTLGILASLAVLCFHFPELLTSREVRAVY